MSYSIGARGATKQDAMAALVAQFDAVVKDQPIHAVDGALVKNAAQAVLDTVTEVDESKDYCVRVSGDVIWNGDVDEVVVHQTNVTIFASLVDRH